MRGKTYFRERKSDFSLDFPAFGLSVLVRARGEVGLRCKVYAARATRGHRFVEVSTTPGDRGSLLLVLFLS